MQKRLQDAERLISLRLKWLLAGAAALTAVIVAVVIVMLYQIALREEVLQLSGMLRLQGQLVDSVARFDAEHSTSAVDGGAFAATVSQLQDALKDQGALGESGEILTVHKDKNHRAHYLTSRHQLVGDIDQLGGAMALALAGGTGHWEGKDYRGKRVLAAYVWVPNLKVAMVAKRDIDELRRPYMQQGGAAAVLLILVVLVAIIAYQLTANPILKELHRRANLFESLFVHGPDAMLLHDADTNIIDCNEAAEKLLGYSRTELIGKTPLDFSAAVQPDGQQTNVVLADNVRQILNGELVRLDWRLKAASGKEFDSEVAVGVVEFTKRPWLIATLRDLTERQQMQAELDQAKRNIVEQRDELAHADRAHLMGQMAASITHEISQPLAAISIYATATRERLLKIPANVEAALNNIDKLIAQTDRSEAIVVRMRDFARKQPLQPQTVKAKALIREALELARIDLSRNNTTVEFENEIPATSLLVDPIQIQQVLINLIRNGMQAQIVANRIEYPLQVATKQHDKYLEISLSDHGTGLPVGNPEAVFEPYFTTRRTGMGMGLTICRSICEAHGGKLTAKNTESGGAKFTLKLPISTLALSSKVSS